VAIAVLAGLALRRWISRQPLIALGLYAALWLAFYTVYVIRIGI
jgi:hypothetical protein